MAHLARIEAELAHLTLMREYLERYPSGRQSPAYRDYIAAHS